jgi:tetratricopeptide (TPR) repeat protein
MEDNEIYKGVSYIEKALCLFESEKLDEAKELFERAVEECPDDVSVTMPARFTQIIFASASCKAPKP